MPVLCKLALEGCDSPLTFYCNITDVKNADLKIFLSTQHKEPNAKACQRIVDRKRLFKFHAPNKRSVFGEEDVCYFSLLSVIGCTITIRAKRPEKEEEEEPDAN